MRLFQPTLLVHHAPRRKQNIDIAEYPVAQAVIMLIREAVLHQLADSPVNIRFQREQVQFIAVRKELGSA
ncbi:hypothetical protein D3C86_1343560 [compost metagenome]